MGTAAKWRMVKRQGLLCLSQQVFHGKGDLKLLDLLALEIE